MSKSIKPGDVVQPLPIDHGDWEKAWGIKFDAFPDDHFESDPLIGQPLTVFFMGKSPNGILIAALGFDPDDPTLMFVWPVKWVRRVALPQAQEVPNEQNT